MKQHIKRCRECQLFTSPVRNSTDARVPVHYIFEQQFSIDFVGPLPKSNSGNMHVLVAVEAFSRWPLAIAVPTTKVKSVSKFLYKHIFCVFGPSTHLLSDNGSAFDNEIINGFLNLVSTRHKFTAPYRPQTNGRNEQMNDNI